MKEFVNIKNTSPVQVSIVFSVEEWLLMKRFKNLHLIQFHFFKSDIYSINTNLRDAVKLNKTKFWLK